MLLISISFCILSSNTSSLPVVLGHGLANRACYKQLQPLVGSGGSWTQPPAWTSCAAMGGRGTSAHRDVHVG